jgi:hypothetical protein
LLISSRSVYKHGPHRQFLFLIGRFLKTFSSETARPNGKKLDRKYLWKVLYKVCLISSQFVNKHGHHRKFLFLVGRFLNNLLWNWVANEPKFGRKHLWKVLYKVFSKQNERWVTQAPPTEPLVLINCCFKFTLSLKHGKLSLFCVLRSILAVYILILWHHWANLNKLG